MPGIDFCPALRWVHDNIERFGGAPDRVMIFGESGGGMKTSCLTAMPSAHGLFSRASVESDSMLRGTSRAEATETGHAVLAEIGLKPSQARELLTMPVSRFIALERPAGTGALRFGPVVDGHYLPANPYDPVAPAISAKVLMIVGTNENEAVFFFMNQPAIFTMTEPQLRERTEALFHEKAGHVLSVYRRVYPNASPTDIFLAIMTAHFFWANAIKMAERKGSQNAAPVYMHMFRYQSNALANQNPPYPFRASHAMEIAFKFDHPQSKGLIGTNPARFPTALNMSGAWASFARNGNPDCDGIPHWPAYTLEKRETMFIDAECRVVNDPWREQRLLWSDLMAYTTF